MVATELKRQAVTVGVLLLLVSLAAGCTSGESDPQEAAVSLQNIRFQPDTITVSANRLLVVTLTNEDSVPHTFEIEELPNVGIGVAPGEEVQIEFTVEDPGTYTIVCNVLDHREQGMVGELIVERQ